MPTRTGGGTEPKASLLSGFGDIDADRYNANFGAGDQHIKPIFGADRSFASNINVGERLDDDNVRGRFVYTTATYSF